jgi:hypothetical protein
MFFKVDGSPQELWGFAGLSFSKRRMKMGMENILNSEKESSKILSVQSSLC